MAGLTVAVEQLLSLGQARIEAHARKLAATLVSDASKYGWEPFRSVGDPAGSRHIIVRTNVLPKCVEFNKLNSKIN
jgi:hypothetical protein